MEKRAFPRRAVRLEGVCVAPGLGRREVEIRDFCAGGMLLACIQEAGSQPFYSPSNGEMVEIRCSVPLDEGLAPLLFRGRIVRVEGETAGLAFIDPDLLSLQRLQAFAKVPPLDQPLASAMPSTSNVDSAALAEGFRSLARASIDPLLKDFIEKTVEQLYLKTGAVDTIAEKNAFYDAVSTLDKRGTAFKQSFTANMNARLSGVVARVATGMPTAGSASSELSLVQEEVFEEWLAFSDTTRKSEVEHQQLLSDLGFRLEVVLDRAVTVEDNPVGPASFARAFQETLQQFSLHPNAARVAYGVFRDVLVVHLGRLYAAINTFLIEQNVLPDLRFKYRVRRGSDGPRKTTGTSANEAAPQSTGAGNAPAASVPGQDWYQLVQDLAHLQHLAGRPDTPMTHTATTDPASLPATPPRHYYAPEDLDAALSRIKADPQASRDRFHESIKLQLLTTLAKNNPEGSDIRIGAREETILDVADNLIDSALNDKLVSTNVTPWLKQLSVPLVKTALRDESVFSDRSHWARQVVNAVAQLEFYGGEGDAGHTAVAQRIDNVLADIANAETATPEVFKRALRELNALIRIQHKAYLENVKEVLAEERRTSTGSARVKPAAARPRDARLAEWYQRVRRLKVGHSILFDPETAPRRLRLAWVSKDLERYVFVNVKGLKDLAVTCDELVKRLHDDTAMLLDDGGEPLMDRAQYAMLQKMHRNLLHETTHDHLTGLANRREFERMVTDAIHRVQQGEGQYVVGQLDLTQFNVVNSTFGYDSGDRVLVDITELLRKAVAEQGELARIGGDEFAVLLEEHDIAQALEIAAKIKEAVQHYRFSSDNKTLAISFSAGLAPITPDSVSATELLQATESASQIARGKGVNYTQVFNAEDSGVHRQHEVAQWVARIDTALDSESLDLRYQPIVGIETNGFSVHHSEILLGVLDEQGRTISPAEFILAAERFRRMTAVDRWVIEHAFRWMVDHADRMPIIGGLAINLSGISLNEDGFADFVLALAKQIGVPMEQVCFEITETAGIANLSNASEFIVALKKTGCMFSLDDFGSGHSSYAYLKNLPVDFLKIDGVFIKNMDQNPYDYAVVKSITEIGHFMGKRIIAEYVESEAVLKLLREIGVDFAQGHIIAKPQSLKRLA